MVERAPDRWFPHRAGIRNIWEYDDQVFSFAGGRLILRGPNGSGKSNALALIFPFLIDGTLSASAMDPFAGGRSMKSLLLGVLRDDEQRRYRHDQRLGYVWLELRREDPSAPDRTAYVTIGCGARASAQGDARPWFFVTHRRVGVDLDLAPDATPLTRGRLTEELGAAEVFTTAEAYRTAVDRQLYGLGPERLAKLVALIRVLRRPQLAGKLNLDLLSEVLSGGLPAVDPGALEDVASSLDDLERTQAELADLRSTLATVEGFLPTYTAYLSGEATRRAAAVIDADRGLVRSRRQHRAAIAEVDRLAAALAQAIDERQANAVARDSTDARRSAHLESPAYQSAHALAEVGRYADQTRRSAADALSLEAAATERSEAATARADRGRDRAREESVEADRQVQQVLDLADAIDAPWTLTPSEQLDPDRFAAAASIVDRERRAEVRDVRAALAQRDAASSHHGQAEARASAALRAVDHAIAAAEAAGEAVNTARTVFVAAVQAWIAVGPETGEPAAEQLAAAASVVGEPGQPTLAERFRELTAPRRDRLVSDRTRAVDLVSQLGDEERLLQTEHDQVAAEADSGPAAPVWRSADRSTRSGAPLWAACDFSPAHPGTPERAGIEAALDAAGLLDAWIAPGAGSDASPVEELDAWLRAPGIGTDRDSADQSPTLATVLDASVPLGSGLDRKDVDRVLRSISLGRVGIAVQLDGSFTLGPLRGRATKAEPEFIGATARAERRRRRLEELRRQLVEVASLTEAARSTVAACTAELDAIEAALASVPSAASVEAALAAAAESRATVVVEQRNAEAAEQLEAAAAGELAQATGALRQTAAGCRVEPTVAAVDALVEYLDRFVRVANLASASRRQSRRSAEQAEEDRALATAAATELHDRTADHDRWAAEAAAAQARFETLTETVGADAEAAVAELTRIDSELRDLRAAEHRLDQRRSEIDQQVGAAKNQVTEAEAATSRAKSRLTTAADRLPVLRRADLLALVLQRTHEAQAAIALPTDPVEFASWLASEAAVVPPDDESQRRAVSALDRAQRPLLDDLNRGYDGSISHDDDLVTVQITSETGTFGLAVLLDQLRDQETQLASFLTEGDRQVFERFLLNRVSHELRRLLAEADEFVTDVNRALDGTATASGLRVELAWTLATDDAGVADAVRLLRHDTDHMGDEDRATLRAFFDRVIRQERAADPEAGYRVALERALDYRAWHVFQPYLRAADGGRAKLTRSRFRELSGGEQAVSLHLPLFAAAAAHYARAVPTAPRLVALDEAFAGIDEAMRGELMALTVLFGLDVILTGHELWGAYAEVPSIAVHDLLRRPPAEGVSVFSLRWDGAALIDEDDDDGLLAVPVRAVPVPASPVAGGLFAPGPAAADAEGDLPVVSDDADPTTETSS